jgi:hypothetical protein
MFRRELIKPSSSSVTGRLDAKHEAGAATVRTLLTAPVAHFMPLAVRR